MENQVANPPRAGSQPSAARLGGSANLPEWRAEGRGLLQDLRSALDTRYPTESQEDPDAETPPWRGIGIGLATFVPTFLLVFIGLPYLLAPTSVPPALAPVTMPLPSTTLVGSSSPVSMARSAVSRPEFFETRLVSDPGKSRDPARVSEPENVEPQPLTSVSADTVSWERAAAFADERAAGRLATTMRSQGYRVDVRREDSTTLRWVVWISKSQAKSRPSN